MPAPPKGELIAAFWYGFAKTKTWAQCDLSLWERGRGLKNKHPQRTAPELKQPGHALRMLLLCGGHAAKNKRPEPFSFEKRFGSF